MSFENWFVSPPSDPWFKYRGQEVKRIDYSGLPEWARGASGTGVATAGNLQGAGAFNYDPATGGQPQVPSPVDTAATVIAGNAANLPEAAALSSQVNAINQQQYYSNIPDYSRLSNQSSANIGDALAGKVPTSVAQNLMQSAAERGVASGGSNPGAGYLKNLGLTSLDQTRAGEQQLSNAVLRGTRAPFSDPSSMFVTPSAQQDAQLTSNIYASAPVPSAAAAKAMAAAASGVRQGQQAARAPASGNYDQASASQIARILSQYAPQNQFQYDQQSLQPAAVPTQRDFESPIQYPVDAQSFEPYSYLSQPGTMPSTANAGPWEYPAGQSAANYGNFYGDPEDAFLQTQGAPFDAEDAYYNSY